MYICAPAVDFLYRPTGHLYAWCPDAEIKQVL